MEGKTVPTTTHGVQAALEATFHVEEKSQRLSPVSTDGHVYVAGLPAIPAPASVCRHGYTAIKKISRKGNYITHINNNR